MSFNLNTSFNFSGTETIDTTKIYDCIVIGGGPAGFNAALYLARKGADVLIISKSSGGQVVDSMGIENYLGFTNIKGSDLANAFRKHVNAYQVPFEEFATVDKIIQGTPKQVVLSDGRIIQAKTIIIASGTVNKKLNIPGENEFSGKGVTYCAICDGPFFKGLDVIVVGGGNTAVESALDLSKIVKKVNLVHYKPQFRADKIVVDKLSTQPNINIIYNHQVIEIHGTGKVEHAILEHMQTKERQTVQASGVFIEIGLLPVSGFVTGLVDMTPTGEIIIDTHCQTSAEGIFAAGDVTNTPYKQIIIAAGEGAKAALSASEYINKH